MKKNKANKEKKWERSDVLSVLAIIISIVSIGICLTQTGIQRRQLESQLKENQPIFQLSYDTQVLDDSVYVKEITIKNVGKETRSINMIRKHFFIELTVSENKVYIPLNIFWFTKDNKIYNITPEYSFFSYNESWTKSGFSFSVAHLLEFVIISYTDIYGEYHVEYFEGDKICSKEYYEGIVNKSKEMFGEISYNIKDLNLDDIVKHIKEKQKK